MSMLMGVYALLQWSNDEITHGNRCHARLNRYHFKHKWNQSLVWQHSFSARKRMLLQLTVAISSLPTNPANGSKSQLNFALPPCRLLVAVVAAITAVDW